MRWLCFALLLLVCLASLAGQDAGQVTVEIEGEPKYEVTTETSIEFKCIINYGMAVTLKYAPQWWHQSLVDPDSSEEVQLTNMEALRDAASPDDFAIKIEYGSDHLWLILTVKSVKVKDDGKFICRLTPLSAREDPIYNAVKVVVVNDVEDVALTFDGEPAVTEEVDTAVEREEGEYGVTCMAAGFSPSASIKIYVGDEELPTGGADSTFDVDASAVTGARRYKASATVGAVSLRAYHSGKTLRCEAQASYDGAAKLVASVPLSVIARQDADPVTVEIEGEPKYEVTTETSIEFKCIINYGLAVTLNYVPEWWHQSLVDPDSSEEVQLTMMAALRDAASPDDFAIKIDYGSDHLWLTLTVKSVKVKDDGKFICRLTPLSARNDPIYNAVEVVVVNDVQDVALTFDGEPAVTEEVDTAVEREEGEYGVTCMVAGFSPSASIKIYVGDEELPTGGADSTFDVDASAVTGARRYKASATVGAVSLRAYHSGKTLRCEAQASYDGAAKLVASVPLSVIARQDVDPVTVEIEGEPKYEVTTETSIEFKCIINYGLAVTLKYAPEWWYQSLVDSDSSEEVQLTNMEALQDAASPDDFAIKIEYGNDYFWFTLTVKSVKVKDDGKFICRLTPLDAGKDPIYNAVEVVVVNDVEDVALTFDGEPAVTEEVDTAVEREEGEYGVTCMAAGFSPSASIKIYVGDEELPTGGADSTFDVDASAVTGARRYKASATVGAVSLRAYHSGKTLRCEAQASYDGAAKLVASVPLSVIALDPTGAASAMSVSKAAVLCLSFLLSLLLSL